MTSSLLLVVAAIAGSPSIQFDGDPTRPVVSRGLSDAEQSRLSAGATIAEAEGRRLLTLALRGTAGAADGPPLFGTYRLHDRRLEFRPRFALVRGATYRAQAYAGDGPSGEVSSFFDFVVPAAAGAPPTEVAAVSPNLPTLPANVLKFYLTFSAPMREGREVLERIRLLDAAGHELGAPWRDLELWNADATRLSLFIHPGRIKQGVNLREEFGPVLEPGRKYVLVVGTDLRDAAGQGLGREFRYSFVTTDELHSRIDVAAWSLGPVKAGSREPLVVSFDRPLDRFLAARTLTVHDDTGQDLLGRGEVSDDGRRLTWTPADRWNPGGYTLRVDPVLEDLCGNSPLRAFDHDLESEKIDVVPPLLERTFEAP